MMSRKKTDVNQSLIDFPSEKIAKKQVEETNDAQKKMKPQEADTAPAMPLGLMLPKKKKDISQYFKPKKEEAGPFKILKSLNDDIEDPWERGRNDQINLVEELRKAKDARLFAVDDLLKHMANMDITGVGSVLTDSFKGYGGASKAVFLRNLAESFSLLQAAEDTVLTVHDGICNVCFGMKRGFAFVAPSSGFYLSLIVETKNGYISKIYNCNEIRFELSARLNPIKRIDVEGI